MPNKAIKKYLQSGKNQKIDMYKNQINKEKVNKPMINNYKKVSDKITQCLILKIKKKCYNYKMRKCI